MMEFEWWAILSYVVGIAGAVFGVVFFAKWQQVVGLLHELGEAFAKTADALEDKKITKEETISLLKEWLDVADAVRILLPASLSGKFLK